MTWQGGTSRGFPPNTRRIILNRDPVCRCTTCPDHTGPCPNPSTDADHIVRPTDGGTNNPDNGQGLCRRCHIWRTQAQAHASRPKQHRQPEAHPGLRSPGATPSPRPRSS